MGPPRPPRPRCDIHPHRVLIMVPRTHARTHAHANIKPLHTTQHTPVAYAAASPWGLRLLHALLLRSGEVLDGPDGIAAAVSSEPASFALLPFARSLPTSHPLGAPVSDGTHVYNTTRFRPCAVRVDRPHHNHTHTSLRRRPPRRPGRRGRTPPGQRRPPPPGAAQRPGRTPGRLPRGVAAAPHLRLPRPHRRTLPRRDGGAAGLAGPGGGRVTVPPPRRWRRRGGHSRSNSSRRFRPRALRRGGLALGAHLPLARPRRGHPRRAHIPARVRGDPPVARGWRRAPRVAGRWGRSGPFPGMQRRRDAPFPCGDPPLPALAWQWGGGGGRGRDGC